MAALTRFWPIAAALLIVVGAYVKGRQDATTRCKLSAAQAQAEYAEKTGAATARAYERGVADAQTDKENNDRAEAIREAAKQEPGANDLCLSGDVVERLRAIQ